MMPIKKAESEGWTVDEDMEANAVCVLKLLCIEYHLLNDTFKARNRLAKEHSAACLSLSICRLPVLAINNIISLILKILQTR